MTWTKRQLISSAYEAVGLAGYVFDLQPEQFESAMRTMDAMLAAWNAKGIRLGYPIPASPEDSNLDDESSIPDAANEAVTLNLGLRLAAGLGKTVSVETKHLAKLAYDTLLSRAAMPTEMQFPATLPLGAGNKTYRAPSQVFVTPPTPTIDAGSDGPIEF